MADPVSPALTQRGKAGSNPSGTTGSPAHAPVSKNSESKSKSSEPKPKQQAPIQGDTFAASLGYGGKDCEALANMAHIGDLGPPGEASLSAGEVDALSEAAAKLMKNLLYSPSHKSYEKHAVTRGHAPVGDELNCTAYVMPAICRDSTKFARPVVPVLCISENGNAQLNYVVYGNEAAPGKEKVILYNLDREHGVALSANVRYYNGTKALWCKPNLVDHQLRYILTMLYKQPNVKVRVDEDYETIYRKALDSPKLTIGLLVVDGLSESTRKTLRGAYMTELLDEAIRASPGSAIRQSVAALEALSSECSDTYLHKERLLMLLDMAQTLRLSPNPAFMAVAAVGTGASSKKRTRVVMSDDSASEESPPKRSKEVHPDGVRIELTKEQQAQDPVEPVALDDAQTEAIVQGMQTQADADHDANPSVMADAMKVVKDEVERQKKKKRDEEEDEEEMSTSDGSDSGTDDSDSDDDSEEEQDDSEEESEDEDSDDDESGRKRAPESNKQASVGSVQPRAGASKQSNFPVRTPVEPVDHAQEEEENDKPTETGQSNKPSPSIDNGGKNSEKEKRKPAKSRRQSMEKLIAGILRQGKGLEDAVPAKNHDKLTARMAEVEDVLGTFVEEGKVVHVHALLQKSWDLVSELFTIVNGIGRAGGPAPPDAAASRKLAASMGRMVADESQDIENLSRDLATWASKMATIVATRAQVAMQAEQDARQLVHPRVSGAAVSSAD
jgi:hypothetical protein